MTKHKANCTANAGYNEPFNCHAETSIEPTQNDLQFISEQIREGNTSGKFFDEETGRNISWNVDINVWKD